MNREQMKAEWQRLQSHDPEMASAVAPIIRTFDCTGVLYIQGTEKPREPKRKFARPFA